MTNRAPAAGPGLPRGAESAAPCSGPGPRAPGARVGGPMDAFSTKSLVLQAQKKLLSKMASKATVAVFIDDTSSEVLDELYRATKEFTRSRKEAQKVLKNLVKVAVKLGVLLRGGQLGGEELALLQRFRHRARRLAMTAVSFHQVDFTFDRRVLAAALHECRDLLHQAVGAHLTAKSHGRINHVFGHLADCDFLAALYGPAEPYARTCVASARASPGCWTTTAYDPGPGFPAGRGWWRFEDLPSPIPPGQGPGTRPLGEDADLRSGVRPQVPSAPIPEEPGPPLQPLDASESWRSPLNHLNDVACSFRQGNDEPEAR
uniref:Tumor necrosis factor alpha-induced protein 8-like protein 1 n=1 Tax=Canis lupus familiaris TaxID=9615 RepID=A0A8C0Q5F2_CANLF